MDPVESVKVARISLVLLRGILEIFSPDTSN